MTQESMKALTDGELAQMIAWAEQEIRTRAEKRKQDTIAKIKEMASTVGVSVSISGVRGRPAIAKTKRTPKKAPHVK